jgi:hypothetical protein
MLKRLSAILLLGMLFFNWYGYQLISNFLQDRAQHSLEASLDKNDYDESQLVSVKIPVTTLSYYNSSTSYERVDGQIDIGGIRYKYVKRRLFKDSLEYLCIPDRQAMRLNTAKTEFFKLVNDLSHNGQGKKNTTHAQGQGFSKDFYPDHSTAFQTEALILPVTQTGMPAPDRLPSSYSPTAERPPDHLS